MRVDCLTYVGKNLTTGAIIFVQITENEFGRATTGRDDRSACVVRFVNFSELISIYKKF